MKVAFKRKLADTKVAKVQWQDVDRLRRYLKKVQTTRSMDVRGKVVGALSRMHHALRNAKSKKRKARDTVACVTSCHDSV